MRASEYEPGHPLEFRKCRRGGIEQDPTRDAAAVTLDQHGLSLSRAFTEDADQTAALGELIGDRLWNLGDRTVDENDTVGRLFGVALVKRRCNRQHVVDANLGMGLGGPRRQLRRAATAAARRRSRGS